MSIVLDEARKALLQASWLQPCTDDALIDIAQRFINAYEQERNAQIVAEVVGRALSTALARATGADPEK